MKTKPNTDSETQPRVQALLVENDNRTQLVKSDPEILNRLLARAKRAEAHAQRLANGLRPFIEKQSGLITAQEIIDAFNALKEWDTSNLNTVATDTATN